MAQNLLIIWYKSMRHDSPPLIPVTQFTDKAIIKIKGRVLYQRRQYRDTSIRPPQLFYNELFIKDDKVCGKSKAKEETRLYKQVHYIAKFISKMGQIINSIDIYDLGAANPSCAL